VGTSGNNIIVGYDRNDVIDGRAGMDAIFAGLGNDTARGGTGDDIIFGGIGNDILRGDEGNDVLVGDAGADTLTGGAGADEFWFRMAPNGAANVDTITDFSSIQGDKIALSTQLFRELNGHVDDSNFSANQTGLAVDADDRLIFDQSTRTLYYDADGSGGNAAVAFVTLTGVSTLAWSDIMIMG
jgi:Ca2+-binding RTX toxin-like protein